MNKYERENDRILTALESQGYLTHRSRRVFNKKTHPALFAAIRVACKNADKKPFKLPDLRGRYPK